MDGTVDVTIRMPKKWLEYFWGWYLDGGGEDDFARTIENESEGKDGYLKTTCNQHKTMIVHSEGQRDTAGQRRHSQAVRKRLGCP